MSASDATKVQFKAHSGNAEALKEAVQTISNHIGGATEVERSARGDGFGYLETLKVRHTDAIPPPPLAWGQMDTDGSPIILGTLGNFSVIIGKAKSRKSFAVAIATAAALSGKSDIGSLIGSLPSNQSKVLYFDTEQGRYHVLLSVKRILKLSGEHYAENLDVYSLRALTPVERFKVIEFAIENITNVGLVIIDGIRDLINSINDEAEATACASSLLRWTEQKNIHIITVLHQNKGNDHARGHLGSELVNKAETVLSVTKNQDADGISTVEAEFAKNKNPLTFSFEIDNEGLPVGVDMLEVKRKAIESKERFDLLTLHHHMKYKLVRLMYESEPELKYTDLIPSIQALAFREYGENVSVAKAKKFIQVLKMGEADAKTPYILKKDPSKHFSNWIMNPELETSTFYQIKGEPIENAPFGA
jgi:hypothetical protein